MAGICLAWAARALASRLMTVLLVGVMEVRGPPASKGRFLPEAGTAPRVDPAATGETPSPMGTEAGAWIPFPVTPTEEDARASEVGEVEPETK